MRGDVVTIADRSGDYTGKPRPAVIVQSDAFAKAGSMVICPLTTVEREAGYLRLRLDPSDTLPLRQTSWIQVEKITAVRSDRISPAIGRIPVQTQGELNRALIVVLGLDAQ
jgi:mRNA interferase MazF